MQKVEIGTRDGFHVVAATARSEAATMVLAPGQSTGGAQNRHPDSDQWLSVLAGTGTALVEGEEFALKRGQLLLIEAGDAHEIRNEGHSPLETLNFYAPRAY